MCGCAARLHSRLPPGRLCLRRADLVDATGAEVSMSRATIDPHDLEQLTVKTKDTDLEEYVVLWNSFPAENGDTIGGSFTLTVITTWAHARVERRLPACRVARSARLAVLIGVSGLILNGHCCA